MTPISSSSWVAPVDIILIRSRGVKCPSIDPDVGDHAAVDVIDRVEDHRPRRRVGVADRRRDVAADQVEQLLDALAGLGADPQHVVGVAADDVRDLGGVQVGLRRRQVDLVQHRDDVQVVLERQVEVGQRLRLDALRGVDEQDAPSQAARLRDTS